MPDTYTELSDKIVAMGTTLATANADIQNLISTVGQTAEYLQKEFNILKWNSGELYKSIGGLNTYIDNVNRKNFEHKIDEYVNYINGLFTIVNTNLYSYDVNDYIYADIYAEDMTLLGSGVKLNFKNNIDNIYMLSISFDELANYGINKEAGRYVFYIYYKNDATTVSINGSAMIRRKNSKNGKLDRTVFNVDGLTIGNSLDDYVVYVVERASGNILQYSPIIKSTLIDYELDLITFNLVSSDADYYLCDILLKEEKFIPIVYEVLLGEYSLDDIGNVLVGTCERDLTTGKFVVYDNNGGVIAENVSVRYGNVEKRTKL